MGFANGVDIFQEFLRRDRASKGELPDSAGGEVGP